jgi:transposase
MDKEHRMLKAEILQGQGLKQWEIAEKLGVTDRTVRNYLHPKPKPSEPFQRPSKLDPFKPFIDSVLKENPGYNREILIGRLRKQGYQGKISILREYAAAVQKRIELQAVIRFETEMGRQAQVDWKEFGKQVVDGKETKLYAFVMVLGYSRKPFVFFTTSMDQATLLACHVLAFTWFGGVPAEILYDNMRTAYQPDIEGTWQPTKRLLALAAHYGFTPHRCRVRRPETKGKVERTVGYLGNNFWPRMEGQELSLSTLNAEVRLWIEAIGEKPIADLEESRNERFARERPTLKPLPAADFDVRKEIPLVVGREGNIRYEGNRYTVPTALIGEMVSLFVHPLGRSAQLRFPDGTGRQFILAPAGARQIIEFPGDRCAHAQRWQKDRDRIALRRRPRKRQRLSALDLEVEVRSPSVYDTISRAMTESSEVQA